MDSFELSPPVFSILSGLIEEKSGLHYGLLDRDLLREKASSRAAEAGFDSLLDYYYYLRYDAGGSRELVDLVDNLVVNETYFFREWAAVRVLVESLVLPLCAAGLRPRIWSAACSTGEEPLSIAMLLDHHGVLDQVEIVATDISARVLQKAQSGNFGRRSVRQVPDAALCDRYLLPTGTGYSLAPHLISAVRWEQLNLLETDQYSRLGQFDAILCRNVLIYFSDATVKRILGGLAGALAADGTLLVGVSESLMRYGSAFTSEERGGAFFYRKADPS